MPKTDDTLDQEPTAKLRAIDVLRSNMEIWKNQLPPLLELLGDMARDMKRPAEAITLYRAAKECLEMSTDCAQKLAPYESAKLESIEVKSQVEHRFVMNIPAPMSREAWEKMTGATTAIALLSSDELSNGNGSASHQRQVEITIEEEGEWVEPGMPSKTLN